MKAEIDGKNQLRIIAENTYESLALDSWYDTFFAHYESKEAAWILNMSKPKANDLVSPALLIELHGDKDVD